MMAKRFAEGKPLGSLLGAFLKENRLEEGLDRSRVERAWYEVMGPGVAGYTQEVRLQGKTLIVRLESSVLREELSYGKAKIIALLNEAVGKEAIEELRLR